MNRITALVTAALLAMVATVDSRQPQPAPALEVRTQAGPVQGVRDVTTGVAVFRGIPYAAPPVGEWRWRPPRPVPPWTGLRRATDYGAVCPQATNASSEDCLFLNVWTPALGRGTPVPVIVLIHGGGAAIGSGAGSYERLAAKGVVLVTMNYRLGLLGHLAHPALRDAGRTGSGNYALLDQIAALSWVQRNITAFGGDPSRVTAAGGSAGAKAVATLLVSPLAKGLFHRAILQSGTGLDDSVEPLDGAEARGAVMARLLGVDGTDADAAHRLRALPVGDILAMSAQYRASLQAAGEIAPSPWRSVVDGWAIPKPVDVLLKAGAFHRVPILIGTNADEGSPVVARDARLTSIDAYREAIARWYRDDTGILLRAYPAADVAGIVPALQRLWGDEKYGAPARAFARLTAAHGVPVYFYFFTRVGEGARDPGAAHASETAFFFNESPLPPALGTAAYDDTLRQLMSDYYVAFAKNGDPNGNGKPAWPRYAADEDGYLELGRDVRAKKHLRQAEWGAQDQLARRHGKIRP